MDSFYGTARQSGNKQTKKQKTVCKKESVHPTTIANQCKDSQQILYEHRKLHLEQTQSSLPK